LILYLRLLGFGEAYSAVISSEVDAVNVVEKSLYFGYPEFDFMFQNNKFEKYLYLGKIEMVHAWTNGGAVPIPLASSHLDDDRHGTKTPDENLVHNSPIPIPSLLKYGVQVENSKNLTMLNCRANGQPIPNLVNVDYFIEDGLVLSFSNSYSKEREKELGKVACVKILNIEKLKKCLDKQLGCKGLMGECSYTEDHQRNHFLKSTLDSWQDEYRLFWKTTVHTEVVIPPGMAVFMDEL